jgi:hypothetical protein
VQTVSEDHPYSYPIMKWVAGAISPGVKRPEHEAHRSSPSSAEMNNGGAIPPFPPIVLNELSTRKHLPFYSMLFGSRDSSVGIATDYRLDDRGVGVGVPVGSRIFSSPRRPDRHGAYPDSYPMGTGSSVPAGRAAGA